jgi:maltooligosyltrehalose synthase
MDLIPKDKVLEELWKFDGGSAFEVIEKIPPVTCDKNIIDILKELWRYEHTDNTQMKK